MRASCAECALHPLATADEEPIPEGFCGYGPTCGQSVEGVPGPMETWVLLIFETPAGVQVDQSGGHPETDLGEGQTPRLMWVLKLEVM
jgi:hypothetical protein